VAGEQGHHGKVTRWVHVGGDDQCTRSGRQSAPSQVPSITLPAATVTLLFKPRA
jgi:hypothetical protein